MTSEEAKQIYRDAWAQYCLTKDEVTKQVLEDRMDAAQLQIARGPSPEWEAFIDTLPGFRQMWARWRDELQQMANDRFGKLFETKPDA